MTDRTRFPQDTVPAPLRSAPGTRCLITTLDPGRALSRALLAHLASELPGVVFTMDPRDPLDAIWVCGYAAGHAEFISELRFRHPEARILVTGRGVGWRREVVAAGADHAALWPVDIDHVRDCLRAPARASRAV